MVNSPRPGQAYGVFKCSDPRPLPTLIARFREAQIKAHPADYKKFTALFKKNFKYYL